MAYTPSDGPFIAVDAETGQIILGMPENPMILDQTDDLIGFIDYIASILPKIHACRSAVMQWPQGKAHSDNEGQDWERNNWSVTLNEMTHVREDCARRVAVSTGWSEARAELEIMAGVPLVLGSNMTLPEALRLQAAAERVGLDVMTTARPV